MKQLLKIAVDSFDADIIIPLDVDEFLTSNTPWKSPENIGKIRIP